MDKNVDNVDNVAINPSSQAKHRRIRHIWVDADACPKVARQLLIKAATRTQTSVTFVANSSIALPKSPWLHMLVVAQGFDKADEHISTQVQAGDLVITSDLPLASAVINKGAKVLTTHGMVYDTHNIGQRLAMRDVMDSIRHTLLMDSYQQRNQLGGQKPYADKDKKAFADGLNRLL